MRCLKATGTTESLELKRSINMTDRMQHRPETFKPIIAAIPMGADNLFS